MRLRVVQLVRAAQAEAEANSSLQWCKEAVEDRVTCFGIANDMMVETKPLSGDVTKALKHKARH